MSALLARVAGTEDAGRRLDVALAAWLDEPRARVQQRVAAGEVTVDGAPAAKAHRLRAGERVEVRPQAPGPRTAPPAPVPVRYEDAHLAVVAKPAGLVVHPGGSGGLPPAYSGGAGQARGTLVDALQAMGTPLAPAGGPERPGIVHRLDRGTSGLLVVAKTDEAYRGLVALLRRRSVERVYWALVDGVPEPPRATIDAPIARHPVHRTRFAIDPGGRRAVTHYDVEEAFGRAARLRVRLETGRTHQVRVHMAAVGHPVCGDRRYGASPVLADELGLRRPALHAARLAFDHPVTGERIALEEPLPDDLRSALASLRGA